MTCFTMHFPKLNFWGDLWQEQNAIISDSDLTEILKVTEYGQIVQYQTYQTYFVCKTWYIWKSPVLTNLSRFYPVERTSVQLSGFYTLPADDRWQKKDDGWLMTDDW